VLSWTGESRKVALVLSGGGAKGAFQLGALEYLCQTRFANSWDMVVGTSIGAMNSGGLAQFNKAEQCSRAVPMLAEFWEEIEEPDDIFESWSFFTIGKCLNPINFLSLANGWYTKGGMCSTEPGAERYSAKVSRHAISRSNVQLFVSAGALNNTDHPFWFTNSNPHIIDYIMASGGMAPVFPPKKVDGMYYVDGGFFSNVPILKAIEEGATEVYVFLLSPLGNQASLDFFQAADDEKMGPAAASYLQEVITRQLLLYNELRIACLQYPDIVLRGLIPARDIGATTGFTADEISNMRQYGYEVASEVGFLDLCEVATTLAGNIGKEFQEIKEFHAKTETSNYNKNVLVGLAIAAAGALVGGFIAFAVVRRSNRGGVDNSGYFAAPTNPSQ
jgi:predicted acylesterase/phospholipase RssA